MKQNTSAQAEDGDRPDPRDFEDYVVYACNQLVTDMPLYIDFRRSYIGISHGTSVTSRKEKKIEQLSDKEIATDKKKKSRKVSSMETFLSEAPDVSKIIICTYYDSQNHLCQLKFQGDVTVPRLLLQVIGLIISCHPNMTSIHFNGGMAGYTILEILALQIKLNNLTDISLDGSFIPEANFDILLGDATQTKNLSLSRCCINDDVVQSIFAKLGHGKASKTLTTLNLASNRITDVGAKYIAEALRSNRHIVYLNLSANQITDDGIAPILETLMLFPLTSKELYLKKNDRFKFLIEKEAQKVLKAENEPIVRKMSKSGLKKSVKTLKSAKTDEDVEDDFEHTFCNKNINTICDITYCLGNNILCILNVAFNHLSFNTVYKLISVLEYQKQADRKPRGLLRINIEGNFMPKSCKEYDQINELIEDQIKIMTKDSKKINSPLTPRKRTLK